MVSESDIKTTTRSGTDRAVWGGGGAHHGSGEGEVTVVWGREQHRLLLFLFWQADLADAPLGCIHATAKETIDTFTL